MKIIDLTTWNRKEHFELFTQYEEPFFGIVTEVDCTEAFHEAKEQKRSFFASYLHKSLMALNEIENFHYRIIDGQVVFFDEIHATQTIAREDGTFAFSFVQYTKELSRFESLLKEEINQVHSSTGLRINKDTARQDVIHYSSIPWINFTGLTHARNLKKEDSIPKITFGKAVEKEGRYKMAVSLNAHHALMDGLQAAQFFELFQDRLTKL